MGIALICRQCGSKDVTRDALAEWDEVAMDWSISVTLDNCDCNACGASGDDLLVPAFDTSAEAMARLRDDLAAENCALVGLASDGRLVFRTLKGKIEYWQARMPGVGCDKTYWAAAYYSGGFEFCGSEGA